MPDFPVALTTFSPTYATAMLEVQPNLHFSLFNHSFATGRGSRFRKQARKTSRKVFSWSDNGAEWMARSIRNQVDGVITDDPDRFLKLCSQWGDDNAREKASKSSIRQMILWMSLNAGILLFELISVVMKGSPSSQVKRAIAL
jgi:phosphatidylglycerol phospholipase C